MRSGFIFVSCGAVIAAVLYFSITSLIGDSVLKFLEEAPGSEPVLLIAECAIMCLVVFYAFRYRKYYVALLSIAQTGLMLWLDLSGEHKTVAAPHIYSDKLTIMMCLMIGIVGSLIIVYAVGYMKEYHHHHKEFKDRTSFFFALLFVFIGAMFGLVFSNNLQWMYFFWEITSVCSFLLIGYTRTDEAMNNAFRALWMNLLGGLAFAGAIVFSVLRMQVGDLQTFVLRGRGNVIAAIPLFLLAIAALTKSAQLPFSKWLLGAMVAPTPTSAVLAAFSI